MITSVKPSCYRNALCAADAISSEGEFKRMLKLQVDPLKVIHNAFKLRKMLTAKTVLRQRSLPVRGLKSLRRQGELSSER